MGALPTGKNAAIPLGSWEKHAGGQEHRFIACALIEKGACQLKCQVPSSIPSVLQIQLH